MQRYFSKVVEDNKFILSEDDSYHIIKVMRMAIGDRVEVVYEQKVYICRIVDLISPVKVQIESCSNMNNELGVKVIICQSLVNEQKMDLVLQKGTELGAYAFYPYKSLNSMVKDNGKGDKKVLRWQRIVKEASEQAKRNIIPTVYDLISLDELVKLDASLKIICTVNEVTKNVKRVFQDSKMCDTMIIVIGPEGGFKKEEEQMLIEHGFISVSLGSRVLRTETAALAVLSMISYEWMV